jgi:ligand-binding sensor domain-containing protein
VRQSFYATSLNLASMVSSFNKYSLISIVRTEKLFFLFFILCSIGNPLFSQEYNYAHYDVKDGLAGSTVYSMAQDKDGFMWYGTETGLSRFDGTHFKNFYTSDGLPDNEILNLFVDSKNRVWVVPFKNSICYYWKGKIHNQENDSLLKQLKISAELVSVSEDRFGDILVAEKHMLYLITSKGKISKINNFEGMPFSIGKTSVNGKGDFEISIFFEINNQWVFAGVDLQKMAVFIKPELLIPDLYQLDYLSYRLKILHDKNSLHIVYRDNNTESVFSLPHGFINVSYINDSTISLNTVTEAYLFNINKKKIIDTLLRHQTINVVAEDAEQNLWFSVPGKGVYRLAQGGFLNYSAQQQNKSIFCIQKFDSAIYAGSDNFYLWVLNINNKKVSVRQIWKGPTRGRITALIKADKKSFIAGTDNGLFRLENFMIKDSSTFKAVKSILPESNGMIVSANDGVWDISRLDFKKIYGVWKDRATCAYKKNGIYYIGTLNGLYSVDSNLKITYLGDEYKIFKNRINAISESEDGTLWVATNGEGIAAYKKNKIDLNITEANGLTSNICRNIFISSHAVWVGTDKGLNKISFYGTGYSTTSFTSADGLSSDIINAVYADRNEIYVGTPDGLTYFDEAKISKKSICNLHITSINAAGNQLPADTSDFKLKHNDNNIAFEFVGISYKSAGKISYQYRLLGLDTIWRITNGTSLSYPSLASGQYELQLKAVNKFGVKSNSLHIRFAISKTLWEKTGFRLLLIAAIIICLWLIINYRISSIKKRENEKSDAVKRIAELEQMALKSQMNPHFIFNCLNSIQHYVIDKDIVGANEFISKFSHLIRLTLENSSKTDISLADEMDYISTYMELEQKRFEDKFTFEIVSPDIIKHDYFIPPMILQPYIENAIRHGVRYRDDNKGKIIIKIEKDDDYLICNIIDNGIGRKLSQKYKSKNPIEYQSRGMELTAKRIEMFNKAHSSKISIKIIDLEDGTHAPLGTEVTVYFPLEESKKY